MREVLALLFLLVLVYMGWKQPYRNHVHSIVSAVDPATNATTPRPLDPRERPPKGAGLTEAHATPKARSSDRSWMWSKSKMDEPYNRSATNAR